MEQSLNQLQVGQWGYVSAVDTAPDLYRRLLDLGLTPGTRVECTGKSPAGDPAAYLIRGAVIALRQRDAANISVALPQVGEVLGPKALAV